MQHNFIKTAAAIFILLLLVSCGTLIKPNVKTGIVQLEKGSYQLDQTHVAVLFKINHMGLSTFVGRFNKVDATLEFDPANIAAAKLSAIIDVASIDANNPDLEETLRGSSWLDTEKYPQAFFKTTSVNLLDQNSAVFAGELTLHGVTAPIDLTVTFNGGANNMLTGFYTLGFSAASTFNRSTFGVDYLIPAIGDAVAIEVFAEFQKN
ncbi:YceI family protein [Cellvibrio fibrivorans]|uniref:Polyisoprenoid-binding protein YceI n=1 Tax=Cellvibrio fibrivorans TaxID=126350 RepID=A0ABU1V217_9GAMM|nr:YceI family protein [Cellvibrio fibrivorans]MDR7091497.1 polyisoprenoid-binding protein YceI [Cellvibrio fibrivorans]